MVGKKLQSGWWRVLGGLVVAAWTVVAVAPALGQVEDDSPEGLYRNALQNFTAGRHAQAIPFFVQLIDIFGREPSLQAEIENAYYGLGCSYYNTGEYLECVNTFTKMIELFPKSRTIDEAWFRIAAAHQFQENYEEAIKAYQQVTGSFPNSPFAEDAAFQTAMALMVTEKSAEAVAAFEAFTTTFPRSDLVPQAMVFMARSYFQGGDYLKALETLEKVGDRTRSLDHLVYANFLAMEIGDVAFEETEYHTALRAFRRVRTNQSLIRFQRKLVAEAERMLEASRRTTVPPSELARHFRNERRLMASLATLKQALEKLESTPDYDASLFHRIGRCFYSIDRYWEAYTAYKRVVTEAKDPLLQEACHFDLILVLNRLRRFGELIEEADRYLATYGKDEKLIKAERVPAVAFMRAEAYINQELFEDAEREMARLETTYPKHVQMPRIRFYKALAIAMQERFTESIDLFEQWLETYPDHLMAAEVAYWLPISMYYDGQYEAAIPLFDAYVDNYAMTVYAPEAAYRSALCKYSMEDYERAASELEAWLEDYPDHVFQWEARVTLGDAYSAIGELEKAKVAYLGVTPEGGPMEYLAISQLNKVFKALDTEQDYRQMADVHIRYLQNNPNSPNMIESAYNAGWALRQIGRIDEARKLYWSTIERFGNNRAWDGFGPLLKDLRSMYRDDMDRLTSEFERMIVKARGENRPTLVSRLVKEMLLWRDMTDVDRAAELERRFNLDVLDAEALAFIGSAHVRAGDLARGQPVLDLLLKDFPNSQFADVAYARKAEVLLGEGKPDEAIAAANTAIDKTADTALMMEAIFTKGLALKAAGRHTEAIEEFNNVLASRASPRPLKPRAMLEAAASFEAMGDFAKAIPYYQRIYVMYAAYLDEMAQAYLRSAAAFEKLKDRTAAISTYHEMLVIESLAGRPELDEARRQLARLEAGS
ncbi:MAG TPA: tetratricopeptide repeat protein [Kiritimatiellia bacterium]|nr:tetratricopeptide repeat protein [Kiritimatiellia bacterium]HMP34735.1 tetratricopeptide repeat protein [Kiritimatiellia bacterium]